MGVIKIWLARLTKLALILACLAAVYAGIKVAPHYLDKWEVDRTVELLANNAVHPMHRRDLESTIQRKLYELDLPLTRDQLKVERQTDGTVYVWAEWSVTVDFAPNVEHTFHFYSEASAHEKDRR